MASGPTITAKFLADTSEMTGQIDKATSSAGGQMKSLAKTATAAIGGAFVADKVLDFGKASVEAAAADAEAQAQLAAALKNTTGATDAQVASAEDFVSNLSKSAAIADDDLRPALATLARGFGDTGKAQDALTLATDVAAGTGKDLTTVVAAMSKGALGSTGALGKLGVATKDASGDAKSMDQIMSDLSNTFKGQAATAAESTAGKMRGAKIAMGEMQETIGNALLPVLGKLAGFLNDTLFPALTTVFGWLGDHKEVVIAAAVGIGAVVIPLFVSWAVAAGAAAAATIVAAAPFILIGLAVAALAYLIITHWDQIKAATQAVWDKILGIIKGVWNWITNTWSSVYDSIVGPVRSAIDFITGLWDSVTDIAQGVIDWFSDTWSSIYDHIVGPIKKAIDFVKGLFDKVKGVASDVLGAINPLSAAPPSIPSAPVPVGATIGFPAVPQLAAGGLLTSSGLVYAHAGEVIAPIEKVGVGGPTVHIEHAQFNDPVDVELLAKHLEFALSAGLSM